MDTDEKMMQKIIEMFKKAEAFQEKMAADRKADKEELMAKMDSNQKKARKIEKPIEKKEKPFKKRSTLFTRSGRPC
jgi:protease II